MCGVEGDLEFYPSYRPNWPHTWGLMLCCFRDYLLYFSMCIVCTSSIYIYTNNENHTSWYFSYTMFEKKTFKYIHKYDLFQKKKRKETQLLILAASSIFPSKPIHIIRIFFIPGIRVPVHYGYNQVPRRYLPPCLHTCVYTNIYLVVYLSVQSTSEPTLSVHLYFIRPFLFSECTSVYE